MKHLIYIFFAIFILGACGREVKKADKNDAILEKNVEVDTTKSDNTKVENNK